MNNNIIKNPIDRDLFIKLYFGIVILLMITLICYAITDVFYYFLSGVFFASLIYIIFYYYFNYIKPSEIIITDEGLTLVYRVKKEKYISWLEIHSLYISDSPGTTLADAGIRLVKGRSIDISMEAASEVAVAYLNKFGVPIPEWNGFSSQPF